MTSTLGQWIYSDV